MIDRRHDLLTLWFLQGHLGHDLQEGEREGHVGSKRKKKKKERKRNKREGKKKEEACLELENLIFCFA